MSQSPVGQNKKDPRRIKTKKMLQASIKKEKIGSSLKSLRLVWFLSYFIILFGLVSPLGFAEASGPSSNRVLNYQIRLTDSSGIRVPDGIVELELTIYDLAIGVSQLYTACSVDGLPGSAPTAVQATFTNGISSILIGSSLTCAVGSAVAIPATLFTNTAMYLGVTVEADAEMTPRKQIVASGYSMNADLLDDLNTSNAGGTSAFVPITDSSGNLTLTGNPQGAGVTQGSLTVNPATADANEILFGVALGGVTRFSVDEDGDVVIAGRLDMPAHGNDVGLKLPVNAGAPVAAGGTVEGDIVWDSTGDALYVYNGAAFVQVDTDTDTGITQIGSMTSDTSFGDATADDDWLGLGAAAGRIIFDDQATDEVLIMDANFGIGDATPTALLTVGDGDLFTVDSSGNVGVTARLNMGTHSDNVGLKVPTNAGNPVEKAGTVEGDMVWNSIGDALYVYDGTSFVLSYTDTGITQIGSMTSATSFGDATADDDWLGLGAAAGRIVFDDSATDYVMVMSALMGVGISVPKSMLHVSGAGGIVGDFSNLMTIASTTDTATGISLNTTNEQWLIGQNLPPDNPTLADDFFVYNVDDNNTRLAIQHATGYTAISALAGATANDLCYDNITINGMYTFTTCLPSSIRYKENVRPLDVDIEKVLALEPVRFDWKEKFITDDQGNIVNVTPKGVSIGLIAENTLPLIPDLVEFNSEGQVESIEYKLLSVYNLAVIKQHNIDISRSLKLDQLTGTAYEIDPLQPADAITTAVDSKMLTFSGSAWNGVTAAADDVSLTLRNQVYGLDDYNLVLTDNASNEIARINNQGDLYLSGRMYLSDRGTMQDQRYIYYDGSAGPGGDFIRTNAAGWSTGSYDFAEMFGSSESLGTGELVMIDMGSSHKVRRATNSLESNGYLLAGIVSTRPGFLAGMNDADRYPVALQGRVPNKVNLENGPISIGDPIAISSIPGVGMRATQADYVVGLALESYNGNGDGLITVFLKVGWYDGRSIHQADTEASAMSLSGVNGILDMSGQPIVGIGALEGFGGLWSLDSNGKLTVNEVEADGVSAEKLTVRADDVQTTVGEGIIPVGSYEYVIDNPAVKFNSRIFVTFFGNIEGSWWVTERTDGRFKIKLSSVAATDIQFEYWILDVVDDRTHSTPEPPADDVEDNDVVPPSAVEEEVEDEQELIDAEPEPEVEEEVVITEPEPEPEVEEEVVITEPEPEPELPIEEEVQE